MERKQFTFYRSYFDAVLNLPKNIQTQVLLAVCDYALNEKEPKLTGTSKAVFELIRPTLDVSRHKAENRMKADCEKNKSKTNQKQNENKSKTNRKQTVKEKEKEKESECEKESEIENEHEKEKESSVFFSVCVNSANTPTLDDVIGFAGTKGIPEEIARRFYLTYSSVGWQVKGEPIANWQNRLLLWAEGDGKRPADNKRSAETIRRNMARAEGNCERIYHSAPIAGA